MHLCWGNLKCPMQKCPMRLPPPPLSPFLPGSANLRGEIIKFVVAQDLFDLCAPELQPATVALKKAILKWAGADQAGAVQLVRGERRGGHGSIS